MTAPETLYQRHKAHVMNPAAGIPVTLQGSALSYRLLIVEGLDRTTVMRLTRQTRSEVVQGAIRWARHSELAPEGEMTITALRRAFWEYRRSTLHRALEMA